MAWNLRIGPHNRVALHQVTAGLADLSLAGYAPTTDVGGPRTVAAGLGALSLTGYGPAVGISSASDLSAAADALSSGEWDNTFTMGGMDYDLVAVSGTQSIIEFTARGFWDSDHRLIQYWGKGHSAGEKLITWDDATNAWTSATPSTHGTFGHAYYHLAMDQDTGDLYLRRYSSGIVNYKPYGGAWTTISSFDQSIDNQVAGGLEWFPEYNGGAGALVYISVLSCQVWNGTSWTTLEDALTGLGGYHNWIARAGGYMWFGGGDDSAKTYRLDSSGNITTNANWNTPINGGVATGTNNPVIAHPNGTHLLQFETEVGGAIYQFDGSTWSSHGTHQIGDAEQFFGVPVSDYGVIVFVEQQTSQSEPVVRVYKP